MEGICIVQSLFHRRHTILHTEFDYLLLHHLCNFKHLAKKKGVVGMSKYAYSARGVCLAVSIKEANQAEPIF